MIKNTLRIINIKIDISTLGGDKELCQTHLLKNAYFSSANAIIISENWFEAYIKYNSPKYALTINSVEGNSESKLRFFISESELLSSNISLTKHYTGEVQRQVNSKILIDEKILHLGVKSICTDQYIGDKEANILEIIPQNPINSVVTFYKRLKPIVDLVLVLSSFAERRRLNWHKCNIPVGSNYLEIYNTRVTFFQDKRGIRLISKFAFEDFLRHCLQKIEFHEIQYIANLLKSYLLAIDYSVNAKIVLWNSILEKILKKNFGKKQDKLKEKLIHRMSIYTSDLPAIQDLIDIRNAIAHGDDEDFDKVFNLAKKWQILIERVLLRELKWNDISKTDVHINGIKPYGL